MCKPKSREIMKPQFQIIVIFLLVFLLHSCQTTDPNTAITPQANPKSGARVGDVREATQNVSYTFLAVRGRTITTSTSPYQYLFTKYPLCNAIFKDQNGYLRGLVVPVPSAAQGVKAGVSVSSSSFACTVESIIFIDPSTAVSTTAKAALTPPFQAPCDNCISPLAAFLEWFN